jgi:glyoxylase-like metal-dependent hydrolase (beta-lactamase superfamily II)
MLVLTPGHTPGHQSLMVKLAKTGTVVLTGDLYHFPGERTYRTVQVNDKPETVASRAKLEALIQKNNAQLWIQHDMVGNRKLKKSPAYYE